MLMVNQLGGMGGNYTPPLIVTSIAYTNFNDPFFNVDLGPPGIKQLICVFGAQDNLGTDPWDWGTGDVGGEPFTYVVPGAEETAGNGGSVTRGITIRAVETSLSGIQVVTMPIVGFVGTMNLTRVLALAVRGFSATPIAYDGGDNEVGATGDDFTISTVGARLVVGGVAYSASSGGVMTGPGSGIVTGHDSSEFTLGYDLAPAGGAADVYSFSGASKYVIGGASFG